MEVHPGDLPPATKVGRFYQIDESSLMDMQSQRIRDTYVATRGRNVAQNEMDTWTSLRQRPLSTYREYRASSTISDTGPQPVK